MTTGVKTRILYFVPCLGTGGTERVLVNLCRALDRERFSPEVFAFTSGPLERELRDLGVPVTLLAADTNQGGGVPGKLCRYLRRIVALRRLIGNRGDTVVHSHHLGPLEHLYFMSRLTGTRFGWLHTEHNRPDLERFSNRWFYRTFKPLTRPDYLVGVSDVVTSYLRDGCFVAPHKTVTILNGIECDRYGCDHPGQKRQELGIPDGCTLIGAVGNLRPEKNQRLLLRAFALLPPESGVHLVICGDGQCRGELEQCAAELGIAERVHFLGYRLDAHEILPLFDVFCLPSAFEGLPMSILEAWSARVPVVATEVVGIRELVRHGEDGMLVPFDDVPRMAESLMTVLNNRTVADRLRTDGARTVTSYDFRAMAGAYESLYARVASGREGI